MSGRFTFYFESFIFDFMKGDSGGPVVKYLPVKSQGKKTYRAHLIGKTLTSQKWLTVAIFLKWLDFIMDYHGLSWTIMDYYGLSWAIIDIGTP